MHELSIASAIVDTALRHAAGRRVTQVSLQVGALRQVVPDSLRFYFEIVARDTACDGARLELEPITAWLRCPTCGHEWDPAPPAVESGASTAARLGYASLGHEALEPMLPAFRCPACERADTEVLRGGELEVESIEVTEEETCIAPR
jgi:hydrogenase nickel incorporation protein HypA/HybF